MLLSATIKEAAMQRWALCSLARASMSQMVHVVSMLDVPRRFGSVSFQSKDVSGAQNSLFLFCGALHNVRMGCCAAGADMPAQHAAVPDPAALRLLWRLCDLCLGQSGALTPQLKCFSFQDKAVQARPC